MVVLHWAGGYHIFPFAHFKGLRACRTKMTEATDRPSAATPPPGVVARRDRALLHITLDRPDALNALTRGMKRTVSTAISRWGGDPDIYAIVLDAQGARAFCSGADLAEFRSPAARLDEILAVQAEETRLLWQIECCIKPSVALIDGLVMGSGIGLSMFGTHRVAGEGYQFAVPKTAIGYFPDAGATHFLGRLPDHIGVYLGLTGARVGRADALELGLVTHCIGRQHYAAIRAGLADADPVDALLDERHEAPHSDGRAGVLQRLRPVIARCFGRDTVEEILGALAAETGAARDWARMTEATLARHCPASLKIALRQVRGAGGMDLKVALETEYRMAVHCLVRADFQEGIRTLLVDKGDIPRWNPATLAGVTPQMVEAVFAPVGVRELILPPRPPSLVALG